MKRRAILIIIACISFLSSCSMRIPEADMVCRSSNGAYDNGNLYYNTGGLNMHYFDTSVLLTKFVCDDPVCDHYNVNCFSYLGGLGSTFLAAHSGKVYSVITDTASNTYSILIMDVINHKKSYLVTEFPNPIGRFIVCVQGVYFCGLDENGKQNIYYANNKGKYKSLTDFIETNCVIMSIEQGEIWFYDFDGNIYTANSSFETITKRCTMTSGLTYGYYYAGGYIYYFDNPEYKEYSIGERNVGNTAYTLYRCSASDPNNPEAVCKSVHLASDIIISDKEIWVAASNFTVDDDGTYSVSGGVIFHIDPKTGKKEEICIQGTDMGALVYAGDDFICGFGKYVEDGHVEMGYIVYDRIHGDQYHIKG